MIESQSSNVLMHWVRILVLTPLMFAAFLVAVVMVVLGGTDHRFVQSLAGSVLLLAFLEGFTFVIVRGYRDKAARTPIAGLVLLHLLVGAFMLFFLFKSLSVA